MSESELKLPNAPIVEAMLDIECDMPPGQKVTALEAAARDCYRDRYPKFRVQFLQKHQIETKGYEPPKMSVHRGVQAFQLFQDDEKQLVQVRGQGFTFNRLAPYAGLDDYLPEIERVWKLFIGLASPVQIRVIRLRYINQHVAVEAETGHQANIVLTMQPPEGDKLPIIFDNSVAVAEAAEPESWAWILGKIQALRALKNRIFLNTLTEKCLSLFH